MPTQINALIDIYHEQFPAYDVFKYTHTHTYTMYWSKGK